MIGTASGGKLAWVRVGDTEGGDGKAELERRRTLGDAAEPRNVLPRETGIDEGLCVKYE